MAVLVEPFASVYDDGSRLGVILARGRNGFEAYAADDHSLGLFPSPRKAAAAITMTRPWVAHNRADLLQQAGANQLVDNLSGGFAFKVCWQFNSAIIALRSRGQNDELRIGKSCHRDPPLR